MVDIGGTAAGRASAPDIRADIIVYSYRQSDPYPHAYCHGHPHPHAQPDGYRECVAPDRGALADGYSYTYLFALADEHSQCDEHAAPDRDQHIHRHAGAHPDQYAAPAGAGYTDAGTLMGGEKA